MYDMETKQLTEQQWYHPLSSLLEDRYTQGRSTGIKYVCPTPALPHHIPDGTLHPQLRVLPVQPLNVRRHRRPLRLAQTLVEDALELELGHALVRLDSDAHLEQAVRGSDVAFQRGVAASHNDAVVGVFNHLEVVGDLGADGVGRGAQLMRGPELVGRLGAFVLAGEVFALEGIAYESHRISQCLPLDRNIDIDLLTKPAPDTRTERLDQLPLLLQQLWVDLRQRHLAHADVMDGLVLLRVVLAVPGRLEQGVGRRERLDGGVACPDEEGADRGDAAVGRQLDEAGDQAHCRLDR